MPAFREFTVFQFNEAFLPNGFAGTAILESDRPIVALADIYTDVFAGDTTCSTTASRCRRARLCRRTCYAAQLMRLQCRRCP